jgi:molybdopterin synthase catalytic subunit/molybdopterin synthase sulfur carrier subunit
LREIVGQDAEVLTVAEGTSVARARELLIARYSRLQPILERSLCAVNRAYVPADHVLQEDDELVFIPPLGGGTVS